MLTFFRYRLGLNFRIRRTPQLPPTPVVRNDPGKPAIPRPEFTVVPVNPQS